MKLRRQRKAAQISMRHRWWIAARHPLFGRVWYLRGENYPMQFTLNRVRP